ncbi:MAG TPA: DUF4307 domain-containing protein [Actinophytocola sp.]|uniref:DUF4307 domain-containing protein n=1 Tax=Actinophytocola sp. TaxID=1872138 RepID=UPI002DDD7CCD|nr:DUF4307 domain-containing protein [Actinophytocola sp.]HEV2778289.1 DUF4307 domain-containing protein [Actinophytocola sp.]
MSLADRVLPEGRYGSRGRPTPRRTYWIVGAIAVVAGAGLGYVAYTNLGGAPIETERAAFEDLPGNAMRLTFTVRRDEPNRAAVCIVRVRGQDGTEGGRKEVLIPPGGTPTSVSTVIRSTNEPVTADVFGCSYQVPPYLSTTMPPSE